MSKGKKVVSELSESEELTLIQMQDALHRFSQRFEPASSVHDAELKVSNQRIINMIHEQYPDCEPDSVLVTELMKQYGFEPVAISLDEGIGLRYLLKEKQ